MRAGGWLPGDQAEIVFSYAFVDQIAALSEQDRYDVLAAVLQLCADPGGTHALGARSGSRALVGWNTLAVLRREKRVVYRVDEAGASIGVLCLGPRRDGEVYDVAVALIRSGLLSDEHVTQIWEALALFETLADDLGLDGWDYRPEPAPEGLRRAAVATGLVEEALAALLASDEITAALEHGWGPDGPDPEKALRAAMARARGGAGFDSAEWRSRAEDERIVRGRMQPRCAAVMPRARTACIRRAGHPGPHRARP
ncbi:MAG TPA: hypothetical protein VGC57_08675 [Cellulomonas sp.]